jgi:glutathione S-transferase
MSITFYKATRPSSATPVQWALAELALPHEAVALDLDAKDQRTAEFLALNPDGRVPTVVVDGTPMFEGLAIIHWLGDRFGVERGLWPSADDPARLRALTWSAWSYVTFGAITQCFIRLGDASPAVRADLVARMGELLEILDGELARRPYVAGEAFSLADVAAGSIISFASFQRMPASVPARVEAWLGRVQARPAFRASWAG